MTQDLKPLLDRATDRPTPYVPDVDLLLTTGRRRTRVRRLTGALATVAAVGAVATAGTFAFHQTPESAAPASSATVQSISGEGSTKCAGVNTRQFVDAAQWSVVVSASDTLGSNSVRRAPDGRVAYCTTVNAGHKVVLIMGGTPSARGAYWVTGTDLSCTDGASPKCPKLTTYFGPLPPTATRLTVKTADGYTGTAIIRDGYFAYRHRGPAGDWRIQPVVKAFDASGHEVPIPK